MDEADKEETFMKAAVLTKPKHFEIREVPKPEIGPDDALIKVERCCTCGTDIHIFNGHYAADELPLVPGHEFAGTIAALGENVTHLAVGAKAVVDINIGCGRCYYCRHNEILNCPDVQQVGISRDGAYAEYVAVPARLVICAPDDAPFEQLALTEPVACVVRSARKADIRFGQSVIILGAGPIGNLHIQMTRLVGAAPIIVAETISERAELARQAGADAVVTDPEKLKETVLEMTDNRGADFVIESVGRPDLYARAFELIRPGGHVVAFGITGPEESVPLDLLNTVLRENSVKGSVAGMGEDMHDAMTLLLHDRFATEAFTGTTFSLENVQQAFDTLGDRPSSLKTQIVFS